jgi:CheY-like chemotaxis protein
MSHALIIDDNMVVSRAIQSRLSVFGFDSFDHTWTEQQALEAASQRPPDLIVVGDHLVSGSPLEIAQELAASCDAPILAVTTDRFMLQGSLPKGASVDGPYPLSDLDAALASTRASQPARR